MPCRVNCLSETAATLAKLLFSLAGVDCGSGFRVHTYAHNYYFK